MGGCIICSPPRYEEPHRWLYIFRIWSTKQKLNTKSSSEAMVVGTSGYLYHWTRMFLEAQGYTMKENINDQDNMSAMKLEMNGRMSCGRNSRHIDIRYFFAKDRVESEGIDIVLPYRTNASRFFHECTTRKPLQATQGCSARTCTHKYITGMHKIIRPKTNWK